MDSQGRLLVLGGFGNSAGTSPISSFRGAGGWWDDVSDLRALRPDARERVGFATVACTESGQREKWESLHSRSRANRLHTRSGAARRGSP
ncbi:MAG: LodA/GoxA family CTQ-dependent oxidase [Actinomycetota bacterium]